MKTIILLLLPVLAAPAYSAPGCAKGSEACTETARPRSPFLEASARDAAAEKPAVKAKAAVKPAAQTGVPAAAPAAPATAEQAPAAAPAAPQSPAAGPMAHPGWSLLALGIIAGLYFYLGGNPGKRKK